MNHVGSIACLKVDKVGAKQNVVSRKAEEQNIFLSPTDKPLRTIGTNRNQMCLARVLTVDCLSECKEWE
jgi:hypothetical protein